MPIRALTQLVLGYLTRLGCSSLCALVAVAACSDNTASETATSAESAPSEDTSTEGQSTSTSTNTEEAEVDTGEQGESTTQDDPDPICPVPLAQSINASVLGEHLDALQALADDNEATRSAGSAGYLASVAYVRSQLEAVGYEVEEQAVTFPEFEQLSPAELASLAPTMTSYAEGLSAEFTVASYSGSGDTSSSVSDLVTSSATGCNAEAFEGFSAGNIALIDRGGCSFVTKAQLAAEAGATAVIIANSAPGGFTGTLDSNAPASLPVVMITGQLGEQLHGLIEQGPEELVMRVKVDAQTVQKNTSNLLADTPGGDADKLVVIGAHLDSVAAGPGINDNGTGSSLVLALAIAMAQCEPQRKVRFAWWGAEERGLRGSTQHVAALSPQELAQISAYLNFDMIGSPNYAVFVHDGDASDFDEGGPEGSGVLEQMLIDALDAQGWPSDPIELDGRSDYAPFADAGIPIAGVFTGAEVIKSKALADKYGGIAGEAFDPCYHDACDDRGNVAMEPYEAIGIAAATTLEALAAEE